MMECHGQSECRKLGGPNFIVEIDESKVGKRKYNKGRLVDGHWLLSMVERGTGRFRVDLCPNNKRDTETLKEIILRNVEEDTEIHTDFWRAYNLPSTTRRTSLTWILKVGRKNGQKKWKGKKSRAEPVTTDFNRASFSVSVQRCNCQMVN